MNAQRQYFRQIAGAIRYMPTWLPSSSVALGEVGPLSGEGFSTMTTLKDLKVPVETETLSNQTVLQYASSSGVKLGSASSIAAIPSLGAGGTLRIDFTAQNAVVFASACHALQRIRQLKELETDLLALAGSNPKKWDYGWSVVTEVVVTRETTAFISGAAGAFIELSGYDPTAGLLSTTLKVERAEGMVTQVISRGESLTPLYRTRSLRRRLFGKARLDFMPSDDEGCSTLLEDDLPVEDDERQ